MAQKGEVSANRQRVHDMLRQGLTHAEIADVLGLKKAGVAHHARSLRREDQASRVARPHRAEKRDKQAVAVSGAQVRPIPVSAERIRDLAAVMPIERIARLYKMPKQDVERIAKGAR